MLPFPRRPTSAGSVVLALALLSAPATAQLPRYVNCGDSNGQAGGPAGYEQLGEGVAPPGISLTPGPVDTVHVGADFPSFWGTLPDAADVLAIDPDEIDQLHRMTALQLVDGTVLRVEGLAPDALFRVRLLLGALAPWGELTDFYTPPHWTYLPSYSRDVRVELADGPGAWRTVASGIRCTSPNKGGSFQSFLGGQVALWVLARSDGAGRLSLRLSTDGPDPTYLSAFEVHEHEALPIVYRRTGGAALQGSTPTVSDFVTAFNLGQYDTAQTLAFDLVDPFERGVALLHLAGWLDGSKHGLVHLAGAARDPLLQALPEHPAAAWLLDERDRFARALSHLAASGYEHEQACPEDGGTGFLNVDCEGQSEFEKGLTFTNGNAQFAVRELGGITAAADGDSVLDQLAAWNAGAVPAGDWEPSPLVFAAAKLTGTTLTSMNPSTKINAGDPDAVAFAARRDALVHGFVDLGFAAVDFPEDLELRLFQLWLQQGALPYEWDHSAIQGFFSEEELAASWWADEIAMPPDDPGAQPWADLQRQSRALMLSVVRYWIEDRLEQGALGGGLGDDIELLAQFGKALTGLQDGGHRPALDAVDQIVRWVLGGSGWVVDGYFAGGLSDVQHTAEYTTNTYLATTATSGHSVTAARIALGVAGHLLDADEPETAFAGTTTLGRTHFKSYHFTAEGPGDDPTLAWDTLINGRAMYPAVTLAAREPLPPGHPLIADLGRWAVAWRDDAASTGGGKPDGWYGPARWPDNGLGNGFWWNHTGNAADVAELSGGVHSYTLELMRASYHRSVAADRWRLLVPAVRMFRAVAEWEDAGQPPNPGQGSARWAGKLLKSSSRFGGLVVGFLGDLASDPVLTTASDPKQPGTTYVDAALIERMRLWVEQEFNGQPATQRYALRPTADCGSGFTAKATQMFTGSYAKSIDYYRQLYPLLTTHVIHTDRVNLSFSGGGPSNLAVATTGEDIVEGLAFEPFVRWRAPAGSHGDVTVQCNARDYAGTLYGAFVHVFGSEACTVELQLDHGLQPGTYRVTWGAADGQCDLFPAGSPTQSTTITKRGRGVPLSLTLAPGQSLVRIEREGDAPPPASYDLAGDPPVARLIDGPGGLALELETQVANLGSSPSPAALLHMFATAMASDGSPAPGAEELHLGTVALPSLPALTGFELEPHVVTLLAAPDVLVWRADERGPSGAVPSGGLGAPVQGPGGQAAPGGPPPAGGEAGEPFAPALIGIVAEGQGLLLRIQIEADGNEGDLLNNGFTRGWTIEQMFAAGP